MYVIRSNYQNIFIAIRTFCHALQQFFGTIRIWINDEDLES